ncbi:MAG: helix-turn-helix transcriptional regulator [Lachnospiraceae bacterium]|nr:helix-turn-helix transcriptional regulator [Lachnospiraceae bacterium]
MDTVNQIMPPPEEAPERLFHYESVLSFFEKEHWLLNDHMPGMYYGGRFRLSSTTQLRSDSLPGFLLLYVFSGSGTLLRQGSSLFLSERSVLFLNCESEESLQLRNAPPEMDCAMFFLRSDEAAEYYGLLNAQAPPLLSLPPSSDIEYAIRQLLELVPIRSVLASVSASKWIVSILSEFCSLILTDNRAAEFVPDYIREMKETFDRSYQVPLHLEEFEIRFSIRKERLCREFSHYYGMPPLRYLNARRIEAAKDLLLSTNMRVYEVGNAVGIENTNHFINLFKKNTGITPMLFKKNAPATVCGLHSPHKPDVRPQ